jgi:hypothetical protein
LRKLLPLWHDERISHPNHMSRPCTCDLLPPPPGEPYTAAYCRVCWLYHNDPAYKALWDDTPQPEGPGILQRAANFAGAVASHVMGGARTVSEDVYQRRLALCVTNECGFYKDNHCLHPSCGCRLAGSVVAKLRWAEQECPVGRWRKEQ